MTYSVATTALEEFWDTAHPIVYLGEWCKRYSRRSFWGSIESTTLQSTKQEDGIFKTIDYLHEVYEKLLPVLAQVLNETHKVNFSNRYWRIVLGPWLLYYLHTLHDKYSQILSLKQRYADFTTICLDESCFVVPGDSLTFANLMKGDAYNLQLYSQLFRLLGHTFPTQKTEVEIDGNLKRSFYVRPKTIANRLTWLFIGFIDRVTSKRKKVVFESVYFPKPILFKLMLRMKGRFLPYVPGEKLPLNLPVDNEVRRKIGRIKFSEDDFEKILLPMISMGLPKSVLEGYQNYRARVRRKCDPPQRRS